MFGPTRGRSIPDAEAERRAEFTAAFGQPEYPVEAPFQRPSVLPKGPPTVFWAADVVVSAIELATRYGDSQTDPDASVESLVNDIIDDRQTASVLYPCQLSEHII